MGRGLGHRGGARLHRKWRFPWHRAQGSRGAQWFSACTLQAFTHLMNPVN
jgi:hypothetical protein